MPNEPLTDWPHGSTGTVRVDRTGQVHFARDRSEAADHDRYAPPELPPERRTTGTPVTVRETYVMIEAVRRFGDAPDEEEIYCRTFEDERFHGKPVVALRNRVIKRLGRSTFTEADLTEEERAELRSWSGRDMTDFWSPQVFARRRGRGRQ